LCFKLAITAVIGLVLIILTLYLVILVTATLWRNFVTSLVLGFCSNNPILYYRFLDGVIALECTYSTRTTSTHYFPDRFLLAARFLVFQTFPFFWYRALDFTDSSSAIDCK